MVLRSWMLILLVDDDSFFRSILKRLLQREGFQVLEAEDGGEAYQIILEIGASVNLLLTDMNMPRMDGVELAQLATAAHPKLAVLLMTGEAYLPENSPGVLGILKKPFLPPDLVQAIRQLIPVAEN